MLLVDQARVAIHLLALRLGLKLKLSRHPLDGLVAELGRTSNERRNVIELDALCSAIDWAELLADRVPGVGRSCLYRSLGRFGVLSAWGFRPSFVMGIARQEPERGHAWLELDGAPFREDSAADFIISFRFPAETSTHC